MTPRTRSRLLWLLVALTAAHALASAAVFAVTGTFGFPALVASLVVYGVLTVAAFVLLATTPRRRLRRRALRKEAARPAVEVPVTEAA